MTPSAVPTDKVYCSVSKPVYWSAKDTEKTVAQIKEHNAAFIAICGKPQSPAKPQGASTSAAGTSFKDRWYEGVKVAATAFR